MNVIDIWEPRWHDNVVLIDKMKVADDNIIVFTKADSLPHRYYLSGYEIRQSKLDSNGVMACYAVPLEKFKPPKGMKLLP